MIDALKRASAKRITVIVPFYGYARQDKKHRGREPISARLMADLFKAAGADRLMTVDLHTSQIQGFFDGPVDHLFALPLLADHVASRVSTDQHHCGVARRGPGARCRTMDRRPRRPPRDHPQAPRPRCAEPGSRASRSSATSTDRVCVVVDDMIDTGGTIVKAAETLFENGAKDVIVAATHGILSDPACDRLQQSQISEVVVTDTLPIPQARQFDKLTVLSIAPLLGTAINEVFTDGSVTSMFEAATADEASSH